MLKLGGKALNIKVKDSSDDDKLIVSVTTNPKLPLPLRSQKAFLVSDTDFPLGFAHYFVFGDNVKAVQKLSACNASFTVLSEDYRYLGEGDIVRILLDRGSIRVLFRASSPHNSILVTEQCNHFCLMCSQPPKNTDDSYILNEIENLIPLIPKETKEIGFTGGEPTLYGDKFLSILALTKSYLPYTSIHILSNGRRFKDSEFAREYANISHHDMMVGIPLYSDNPYHHDYIVQSRGAFDETISGIINLKKYNQKVEIRVVIHKLNADHLEALAEFIARNLLFVDHVALMGLEIMGFARLHLDELWIDPYEYKDTLSRAVNILSLAGIPTSIYNHPLCLVNDDVIPFYRKAISDWKNEYLDICNSCRRKCDCGGFFSSGVKYKYSAHIKPY